MLTIDPMAMPVAEKLKLMEKTWDSLYAQSGGDIGMPRRGTARCSKNDCAALPVARRASPQGSMPRPASAHRSGPALMQVRSARSAETDLLEGCAFYEQPHAGIGDYFLDCRQNPASVTQRLKPG